MIEEIDNKENGVIISTWHDITCCKYTVQTLQESEKRFRTLIDKAADAMFLADMKGNIIDVNIQACESLGYSREELLSLKIFDFDTVSIQPDFKKEIWDRMTPDKPFTIESEHIRKDGSSFPVEIRVHLTEIDGESAILGFARNITERKKAEEELDKHRQHLEELVKKRTAELEEKNEKLEYFNKLFVGREFRIKELRDRVKELEEKISDI